MIFREEIYDQKKIIQKLEFLLLKMKHHMLKHSKWNILHSAIELNFEPKKWTSTQSMNLEREFRTLNQRI